MGQANCWIPMKQVIPENDDSDNVEYFIIIRTHPYHTLAMLCIAKQERLSMV